MPARFLMTSLSAFRAGRLAVALLAALTVAIPAVRAEDEPAETTAPPAKKWTLDVLPYMWVPGQYGSLDVDGRTIDVSVTPSDVLNLVFDGNAFAAAGWFALEYDRFSIFTDTFGGYAEVRVNEQVPTQLCTLSLRAKDKMKFVIGDVGFGYRLGEWALPERSRPVTLGVYTGTRYMWLYNKLSAKAGVVGGAQRAANVSGTTAWADPLIGVRWSVPLLDWASLDFRGDIGGFGASSNLIWGLDGHLKLWLPWHLFDTSPYVIGGYRVSAFDRSNASDAVDLQFSGPTMGAGFTF
jgi:hypothetical protein